jgi:hypothetical protein
MASVREPEIFETGGEPEFFVTDATYEFIDREHVMVRCFRRQRGALRLQFTCIVPTTNLSIIARQAAQASAEAHTIWEVHSALDH